MVNDDFERCEGGRLPLALPPASTGPLIVPPQGQMETNQTQEIHLQELLGGFLELSSLVQVGGSDLQRQFFQLAKGCQQHCEQLNLQLFQKDSDVQQKFEALMAWSSQVGQTLHALQGKEEESEKFRARLSEHIHQMTQEIVALQNSDISKTSWLEWLDECFNGLSGKLQEVCHESIPEMENRIFCCEAYILEQRGKGIPTQEEVDRLTLELETVNKKLENAHLEMKNFVDTQKNVDQKSSDGKTPQFDT